MRDHRYPCLRPGSRFANNPVEFPTRRIDEVVSDQVSFGGKANLDVLGFAPGRIACQIKIQHGQSKSQQQKRA